MIPQVINSERSYTDACVRLRSEWEEHKYLRVTWKKGIDRSLDQNAISHVWYDQISKTLQEDSPLGVKCDCKLRFGVPILCAEDADFREMFDATIGLLSYTRQLKSMEWIEVTSLMTVKQLKAYLEAMQKDYAPRGVRLEFSKEAT